MSVIFIDSLPLSCCSLTIEPSGRQGGGTCADTQKADGAARSDRAEECREAEGAEQQT